MRIYSLSILIKSSPNIRPEISMEFEPQKQHSPVFPPPTHALAMALAIAAIALEFSNSVPLAASPAAVPPARGVARPARHSSSSGVESMGRKIINDFKHDTKARRQRRRDRKSTCAQCGNRAGEGVKLLACSRCKSDLVYYSSPCVVNRRAGPPTSKLSVYAAAQVLTPTQLLCKLPEGALP
jgi:hypothetical protein